MNSQYQWLIASITKSIIGVARFTLYILLLLLGRVLQPITNAAIVVGLIIFLFCLFLRADMTLPMWAGAGLAVAATIVSVFYEAALRLVAPGDVVIVHEV